VARPLVEVFISPCDVAASPYVEPVDPAAAGPHPVVAVPGVLPVPSTPGVIERHKVYWCDRSAILKLSEMIGQR
jgi:hypothetical protein